MRTLQTYASRTCLAGYVVAAALAWLTTTSQASAPGDSQVLYALSNPPIFDGKFGRIVDVQRAINKQNTTCGGEAIKVTGQFDRATADAIRSIVSCESVSPKIASDDPARGGSLSVALWSALLPDRAPPSAQERALTLVLTFEATDYDRLQWNFCQNTPLWNPSNPDAPCYTNDPSSFMTWGPRGATANQPGSEIQRIIARVNAIDPSEVDRAFGKHAAEARALLTLDNASTKAFLCHIFANETSRNEWTEAFESFGSQPVVQENYQRHYASLGSDGGKIRQFFALYRKLGIQPTEIDLGFFLDRAAQTSGIADINVAASRILHELDGEGRDHSPSNIRRAIALTYPADAAHARDRLGRDVAFYIDATGLEGLSPKERDAWTWKRRSYRASDVGLRDTVMSPPPQITDSAPSPPFNRHLVPMPTCPAAIMEPKEPLPRVARTPD